MKSQLWFVPFALSLAGCLFFLAISPEALHAQWTSPSAADPTVESGRVPQPSQAAELQTTILSGKVEMEGGTSPSFDTKVVLECGNQVVARANTSPKGDFSMQVSMSSDSAGPASQDASMHGAGGSWLNCDLYAESGNYRSERLNLTAEPAGGMIRVGTLLLHPIVQEQANADSRFTVSVASLAAPANAKKDFAKGQEKAKKGRWAEACEYFRRAVQVYPRFALAWLELGRAQVRQNNFIEAQQSFQQAADHDSTFIPAYVEMARVAARQQQWKTLAYATDRIVQLAPQASAEFWFLNSAANFNLGNIGGADSSAVRGLRLDAAHTVPQLEYLYGVILAREQNYKAAAEHIQAYLKLSPRAQDAQQAQNKLAIIEKLASGSKVAAR